MAYRAVPGHPALLVTGNAKAHVVYVVDLVYLGHADNVAMAGLTRIRSHHLDMAHVGEVHVPGNEVHPQPLDGLLLRPGVAQLLDLDLVAAIGSGNDGVATHARLYGWNSRLGRDRDRVVAVLALDLQLAGVDVVPEEDGLARTPQRRRVAGGEDGSLEG